MARQPVLYRGLLPAFVLRRVQHAGRLSQDLVPGKAEHPFGAPVPVGDQALEVGDDHTIGDLVADQGLPAQRLLGPLAVGDVLGDEDQPRLAADLDPFHGSEAVEHVAILRPEPGFEERARGFVLEGLGDS